MKSHEHHAVSAASGPQPSATREQLRLAALASFDAETLAGDSQLGALVDFAARLCEVPMAHLSLVEGERQRFLVAHGSDLRETLREYSFCAHAMIGEGLLEIADASEHPQFAGNPLVTGAPGIRFYAGQPLVSDEGQPLGALCLIDTQPRPDGLTAVQRQGLEVLAQAVMCRLTANRDTIRSGRELRERDEQLRSLADSIPAIAWSADPAGNFEYFNKGLIDFIGEEDGSGSAFHPEDWERCDLAWRHSLDTGDTYEVEHRLRRHDGEYRWMLSRAVPLRDRAGRITRWFGTAVDIDEVHRLSESRDLMSRELAHRIKNIFAVVIGLISLEARRAPEHREFADELMHTLRALGRAHDFVRPSGSDTRRGSLQGLLEVLFAPYGSGQRGRVLVSGAEFAIASRAATPLALVFHELATNSAKYGALSSEKGHVTLDIAEMEETLLLVWREHGGPPPTQDAVGVTEGEDSGFGSRLVEMSVTGQLGGSWIRRFEPAGLVVELTISKQAVAPQP